MSQITRKRKRSRIQPEMKENDVTVTSPAKKSLRTECNFCDKTFNKPERMFTHANKDHKEDAKDKWFSCPHCNLYFPDNVTLTSHLNEKHAGSFFPIADKIIPSKNEMAKKRKSKPEKSSEMNNVEKQGVRFPCNFCDKSYLSIQTLNTHVNKVHKDDAVDSHWLQCQQCHVVVSNQKALTRHVARLHHVKLEIKQEDIKQESLVEEEQETDQGSLENVNSENEASIEDSNKESYGSQDKESPHNSRHASLRNQQRTSVLDNQESESTDVNKVLENNQNQNSHTRGLPKQNNLDRQIKSSDGLVEDPTPTNKVKDSQGDKSQSAWTWNATDPKIKAQNALKTGPTWSTLPFGQKQEENKKNSFTVSFKTEDEIEEISLLEDSSDDEISTDSDESEAHLITIGDDDDDQTVNRFPIGSTPAVATKVKFYSNISPIIDLKPTMAIIQETNESDIEDDDTLLPDELEEGEVPRRWKFTGPLHNGYYTSGKWYDTPQGFIILTDYKENCSADIYFPECGPYWCEICHDVVTTNKEFVAHVRTNHLDVADENVLYKMESRIQQ